jgi:hypothetical protein
LLAAALLYIWNTARDSQLPARQGISLAVQSFFPQESWAHVAPAAIPLAIAYPLYMRGIWYLHNLPCVVMLAVCLSYPLLFHVKIPDLTSSQAVSYLFEGITLRLVRFHVQPSNFAIRYGIVALACFFILWDEYRLDVEGVAFAVPASILAGISKGLYIRGRAQAPSGPEHASRFLSATITLTFAFTAIWALLAEETYYAVIRMPMKGWLNWAFNLTFSALALASGGSVAIPISAIDNDVSFTGSLFTQKQAEVMTNFCLSALVAIGSLFLARRSYTSPVQVLAYFVALIPVATAATPDQLSV